MPARHSHGTSRPSRKPKLLNAESIRARWVRAQIVRLKSSGMSFDEIAETITAIGRGELRPRNLIPDGVTFEPDYRISKRSCHQAYKLALAELEPFNIEDIRTTLNSRVDGLLLKLNLLLHRKEVQGDPELVIKLIGEIRKTIQLIAEINGVMRPDSGKTAGDTERRLGISEKTIELLYARLTIGVVKEADEAKPIDLTRGTTQPATAPEIERQPARVPIEKKPDKFIEYLVAERRRKRYGFGP